MATPSNDFNLLPAGVSLPQACSGRGALEWLEDCAAACPEAIALRHARGELGVQQLLDGSLLLAGYLQQHLGLRPEDHLVVVSAGDPQAAMAWYAALHCGARPLQLAAHLEDRQILETARACGPCVAVLAHGEAALVEGLLAIGELRGCLVNGLSDGHSMAALQDRDPRVHVFAAALEAGIAPSPLRPPLAATPWTPLSARGGTSIVFEDLK